MNEFPQHWGEDIRPHKLLALLEAEPVLGTVVKQLGRTLNETVEPRTLELIALRVSACLDVNYVWRAHAFLAVERLRVLSLEEVARVAAGPVALGGWDAVVVRAVDELLGGRLTASSRDALGSRAPRVEIAAGFYRLVATLMADAEPETDVPELDGLQSPAIAVETFERATA
jgi:hypothetical protein